MIVVNWGARSFRHIFSLRPLLHPLGVALVFFSLGMFIRMLVAAVS